MSLNLENLGTKDIKTFIPQSINEVEKIALYLIKNPLILNVSRLKGNISQRVLDILLGASLVLNKGICPLDKENYLFVDKQ